MSSENADAEEWMNVQVDASGGSGKAIAAVLKPIVEVADDAPEWAEYDIELNIEETDTRAEFEEVSD